MADEEKRSLSKPEQRALQGRLAGFGLHCFPDIQVDEPANVRRCLSIEKNFHGQMMPEPVILGKVQYLPPN